MDKSSIATKELVTAFPEMISTAQQGGKAPTRQIGYEALLYKVQPN
jgi:hypothetical protein